MVRAPREDGHALRSRLGITKARNQPTVLPSGSQGPRACADAHALGPLNAALTRTGPASRESVSQARRPFRYIARGGPHSRSKVAVAFQPQLRWEAFRRAMSAQRLAASRKLWQDSPLRGSLGIPASSLPPAFRSSPSAGQSSAEHSDRPTAADGREWLIIDPASPDPRACPAQHRGTGLAPLVPDSELCSRSTPFRCTDSTPLRSDACKHRRQATRPERYHFPGGVSTASSASATCASETVPTRSLADLTPPPILVCPPCRAAARSPPARRNPSFPRWPRRYGHRLDPDGRTARPPRTRYESGVRLRDFSYGYDAHTCASGPSLKSRRLSPQSW